MGRPAVAEGLNGSVAAVKSAKRALEVMELLDALQRSATVAEVAARLKYPQSSTSSLLAGLKRLGYLEYCPVDRTYALSLRVALIGMKLRTADWSMPQIHALVSSLHNTTGLTAVVCRKHDVYMQYVYAVGGIGLDLIGFQPGRLLPLCDTAGGIALISSVAEPEIGKMVRRINAESSFEAPLLLPKVMEEVRQFREQGHICISGRVFPKIGSVSVRLPFSDMSGHALALCVAGRAENIVDNSRQLSLLMTDQIKMVEGTRKEMAA